MRAERPARRQRIERLDVLRRHERQDRQSGLQEHVLLHTARQHHQARLLQFFEYVHLLNLSLEIATHSRRNRTVCRGCVFHVTLHMAIPEISTSYHTVLKSGPRRSLEVSPTASIFRGVFRLPASSSAHAFRRVARTGNATTAFTPSQTVLPVPQSTDGRPPRVPCRRGTRGGTSRFPAR